MRIDAEHTVIRPGDTIIVRSNQDIPRSQLLATAERLRDYLPDVEVIVLAGIDGIEVYRPGE